MNRIIRYFFLFTFILIASQLLPVKAVFALLPGDANCDTKVDGIDYVVWLQFYGKAPQVCPSDPDFNNDNKVDGIDYVSWLTNYGKTETPTLTPTIRLTNTPIPPTLTNTATPTITAIPTVSSGTSPVVVAVGDIACGSDSGGAACKEWYTSEAARIINPVAVLLLGDNQYEQGQLANFDGSNSFCQSNPPKCFNATWGRLKNISYPAVGNHEYLTANASGYFDYFNGVGNATGRAGDRNKGYYAFNIGSWRLYALNTNCSPAGGCGAGSPQERWLRADLAANPKQCALAYYHHPLHSSGGRDTPSVAPLFQALYDNRVELVLAGHEHNYERFAPQTPQGVASSNGIQEIIVGTGGRNFTQFVTVAPNSLVRNANSFGVLKLTLNTSSYAWEFVPASGYTFKDSGTGTCH